MNYFKIVIIFILITFQYLKVQAQPNNDYKAEWAAITRLENKGLTKDALKEVVKIFNDAIKTGNQAQQIKAAMYQMKYRNSVEEDNSENNIFYLDTLIAKTKSPAKNILQSMQAELLQHYKEENRYELYQRTALVGEKSKDISTWSINKLNSTIEALYKVSLQNETILKTNNLKGLDAIITKGQNSRQLRPTLYDFLAHRALAYFINDENDISNPSYQFIINDEKVLAPVKIFVQTNFFTKDSSSNYYNAISILQDLLRFHLNDPNKEALLDADLIRLDFANEHAVLNNKATLYENALLTIEKDYAGNPQISQAMYLRAQEYFERGSQYHPFTAAENQFEIKRAKELCDSAISTFPKSDGAVACKNLLSQIKQPFLNLETEKVNIPNEPFRTLVKYKNASQLHLRIIKITREDIINFNFDNNDSKWAKLLKTPTIKNWSINLPDLNDFQQHSTEIKIEGLAAGTYMILASHRPGFEMSNNIIAAQLTLVSNISYIYNNKQELYVLDRNNGTALSNASIQIWEQHYDYSTRTNKTIQKEKFTTDKNGYVKIILPNGRYNNYLQIKYNNDELFTQDNYYSYNYNSYKRTNLQKSFLFTDRSIYRPGQTVFFKGIVVSTDSSEKKSSLVTNYETSMELFDANQQKIGSLKVTTNAFGSFTGNFKLPDGTLNGQFFIKDPITQSQQYFSVEEYKRPKFLTEIKKPEGTYRLNDLITITGNAKAFAGNNIDGAKVSYRVVRKVQFPIWSRWGGYKIMPPFGNRNSMEITNGATTTDANGNFNIVFKAIPDETINKNDQPTFYYEISADVTDINGETRSGETTVAVAYQTLVLNIAAATKMPADSLKTILINSTNINGLYEQAIVQLSIHKLQEPDRIFRNRYWENPDQFVMSKDEYYTNFPYDVYADEDDEQHWALGNKVVDKTTTTAANGEWKIEKNNIEAGWYKIIAISKDKYGETVKAEKIIRLFDSKKPAANLPVLLEVNNSKTEPGQNMSYQINTGFEKIWLIHTITKTDGTQTTSYKNIRSTTAFSNTILATENDRGGIHLNYAFVQHNRIYEGNENINIPWTNKELNISFETFRDKLLPGSEEKWTVKISGSKGEKTAAEMLVNMYDASLDQFKPHSWNTLQTLWPTNISSINWVKNNFGRVLSEEKINYVNEYKEPNPKSYDALVANGWNDVFRSRNMYYREKIMSAAPVSAMVADTGSFNDKKVQHRLASETVVSTKGTKKEEDPTAESSVSNSTTLNNEVQIRKNFNETAFFFPQLNTDTVGNISFSFSIPEALTQWKLMTFAHNKELASGYAQKTVVTQKPLMVQPNVPRFLREGDAMELPIKIVNLSDKEITGTAQLELIDAATNNPVDGWFKNVFPNQYFTVAAGQSVAMKFPIEIPFNFNSALLYRIKAVSKAGDFSDGEETAIPILTNRMLVTESFPLNIRNTNSKNFVFEKLLNSDNSSTLKTHALTVEYTSNPAWLAVQSLPYLMEYPYECAEQNFNRYYANVLAGFIVSSTPKIKAVFEKWKTLDTAALLSNLQKNESLKAALLQETPWVLDAKNEQEQKKNITILFDMVRLSKETTNTLNKLKEMQSSNGGFTWFKGGPDDRYITQYIITGIGHLRKLKALNKEEEDAIQPLINKALPYLDARINEEYANLIKYKVKLSDNHLSNTAIQYLYMRSFFSEIAIPTSSKKAVDYFTGQSKKYWLSQGKYMQALIALSLHRCKDASTPKAIINSLKQNAIYKEEMGMYWKEFTTGGYYWHQAPIESQALMIEAFSEIDSNEATVNDLKTWLVKNKQTQNWKTTKATAEACYALLLNSPSSIQEVTMHPFILDEENMVTIQLGANTIVSSANGAQAGTGYFKQKIEGEKVNPAMGNIKVSIKTTHSKNSTLGGWGAVYWQYFEDLDKITPSSTPLKLVKKLYVEQKSDRGLVLNEIKDGQELKVGDKIKVRIELKVDRDMEYVHMKDMRAASMEPVNVLSQYKWQGGLGYYESTKDASTHFFFNLLPRGSYVFEYPMFVSQSGNFSNGITSIQCMYAPEFISHTEGIRVQVE